ncbi:MAG: hypothetical protein ACRDRK_00210 [Pseudonocardia sp.]
MGGLTFARLLRDALAQRTAVVAEIDLDMAKRMVDDWLEHIRRAVARIDPSGRHTVALRVLERSFAGVLRAVRPAPPPPSNESGLRKLSRWVLTVEPPPEPARVHLDGRALFQQLLYTAEAVDALLDDAVAPEPVRETLPWADDQELLAQLWPLLSALATDNGDAALAQLRQLEQTLRLHHGVEMRVADDTATAEDFDLHPGDGDHYVTVTPAVLVRGKLWKRGEARRPKGVDVAADGPRTAPDREAAT